MLSDPDNVGVMVRLAGIERDLGEFDRASAQFEEALAVANTPQDLAAVYEGLSDYYESRGQLEQAMSGLRANAEVLRREVDRFRI